MASFTHHQDVSMRSLASHILRPKASTLSVRDRVAGHVDGETMHTGRKKTDTMDRVTKGVVSQKDPNGGCLVTKEPANKSPLDHAHIFPRCEKDNDELLTMLEHLFGIKYGCLNIDDAMNVMLIKCDWHRHYDARRWLMLPTIEMVDLLELHKPGEDITKHYNKAPTFQYKLVPIGPGGLMNVYRDTLPDGAVEESLASEPKSEHPDDVVEESLEPKSEHPDGAVEKSRKPDPAIECFRYPYTDLPPLESHVHPHWVILNTGPKLIGISEDDMPIFTQRVADAYKLPFLEASSFVHKIIVLYLSWLNTVVPPGFVPQQVAPTVPPPTTTDNIFSAGKDMGSVKSSSGNRFVKRTMAAISYVRKRTSSSSFVSSSIRSPARKSKRGKVGSSNNGSLREA